MKKGILGFLFVHFIFFAGAQTNPVQFVNPFIGTGGHGHTFPGAVVPFGMVQVSPDTRIDGSWDGCSGYHRSDSIIYGFSHTHLSGTGCSDYGDIMIMPMMGNTSFDNKIYSSRFLHNTEKAAPGYYSVKLEDDQILAELTTSARVALHKYTFTKGGKASFIVDLNHRDKLLAGVIKVIDARTLEIYRVSEAWAKNQKLYARIEFSKPWLEIKSPGENEFPKKSAWDRIIKSAFLFPVVAGDTILVKVTLSPASVKGCWRNIKDELPTWDFDKVRKSASDAWNKELNKIEVNDPDARKKTIFYSALYHCMIHPSLAMDIDSMYRGMDDQVYKSSDHTQYSVFSLWDTFRALHPLLTIIDQKRTNDFINTFLSIYDKGKRLPVWELSSNETDCMIGYHSVSVIADAYAKGIRNYNAELALAAMKKSATWKHLGLPSYMAHGFLSVENESESVSKTLEYAYDDWCIGQMALLMNKTEDYAIYSYRAQHWKNIFDPVTGFMRPKENGNWLSPFDPRRVDNNFTEANSWQYSFFVPQDIPGLIETMGGYTAFEAKLDGLFTAESKTTGREQSDITGLIGQYAHGNEPSHATAYLYNYIGKPWKTQERIHQIVKNFYTDGDDGLIGNEDCGQMSAWLVLSAMGIYAVTPGMPIYNIGVPMFQEIKIHLENGKTFEVKANGVSDANFYIQRATLNNNDYSRAWIEHSEIMKGGKLVFDMGNTPNTMWASESFSILAPAIIENKIVPAPLVMAPGKVFKDSMMIEMKGISDNYKVFFSLDGKVPGDSATQYVQPFQIHESTIVYAVSMDESGKRSLPVRAQYFRSKHPDWKIKIRSMYNSQYTAGGDEGIIDGLRGDVDWRKGGWQGFQAQDFEATVDLNSEWLLSKVGGNFLQDMRSWILFPKNVKIEVSQDGSNFTEVAQIPNTVADTDDKVQTKEFIKTIAPVKARYLRIKATNYGTLPAWHAGAGGEAFVFIDEIIAE